jgi:hypothetical protein
VRGAVGKRGGGKNPPPPPAGELEPFPEPPPQLEHALAGRDGEGGPVGREREGTDPAGVVGADGL